MQRQRCAYRRNVSVRIAPDVGYRKLRCQVFPLALLLATVSLTKEREAHTMSAGLMEFMMLEGRAGRGRVRSAAHFARSRGRFAEIFADGDAAVQQISDVRSAISVIRGSHPRGADLILIGLSAVPGLKVIEDLWGVTVLIGLHPTTLDLYFAPDAGDEVLVAFDQGALRPAGVIGFLWEGGSAPASQPPESNPTMTKSRLNGIRHLRRLNLT